MFVLMSAFSDALRLCRLTRDFARRWWKVQTEIWDLSTYIVVLVTEANVSDCSYTDADNDALTDGDNA